MDTANPEHAPPAADDTATADEDWTGHTSMRLNDAEALLDQIGEVIETVDPGNREHAADLLDAAIEILARLRQR